MRVPLHNVKTSFHGFQMILDVHRLLSSSDDVKHEFDMSQMTWLEGNMCAPFGAVIASLKHKGCGIELTGVTPQVQTVLKKNGFLEWFSKTNPIIDTYGTTIQYRQFGGNDRESFQDYIKTHFRPGSKGLPEMSLPLLRKFRESLFEIYLNAVEHSETKLGIFACGQFFPKRNWLKFSIADLGIGIREKIRRDAGLNLSAVDAIKWAVGGNTTRKERPGGLGLQLIREFIKHNKGRIVIVSDSGHWEVGSNRATADHYNKRLGWTVVTMEINTADEAFYRLKDEVDANDIF